MHASLPGNCDVVVVGGGIVGLATAMSLIRDYAVHVLLLEAECKVAAHQTGHNSGVIHAGLYYQPGSLKARNCVAGREALYRFCEEHGIRHERCGKLVVATHAAQLPALDELERRGRANGITELRRLRAEELRDYEPHVTGVAGLHVPVTGIVRYRDVAEAYARIVREGGGEVHLAARFLGCQETSTGLRVRTTQGELRASHLIACAGLQADRVAWQCGVNPGIRIVPFRGDYYQLAPDKECLVRNLIYPVPDPRFPFLGVHFTRLAHGGVEAGPNAVLAFKREGYRRLDFSWADAWRTLSYVGWWRLAGRYWRMGLTELHRSFSRRAFARALQNLVPEVRPEDLRPAGSGVRAQALGRDGRLVDDFLVIEAGRMLHVLNAPSPAATASLAIGATIAQRAAERFGWRSKEASHSARPRLQ